MSLTERRVGSAVILEAQPAPEPAVSFAVTQRQARLALHAAGLLGAVQAAIDAMQEPDRTEAQIAWDYASEVRRDDPLVQSLAPALGLTPEQLDALFEQAAQL